MSAMSASAHLSHLRAKHAQLKEEIQDAYNHHESDEVVHQLKKQKLQLKEEMVTLEKLLYTRPDSMAA